MHPHASALAGARHAEFLWVCVHRKMCVCNEARCAWAATATSTHRAHSRVVPPRHHDPVSLSLYLGQLLPDRRSPRERGKCVNISTRSVIRSPPPTRTHLKPHTHIRSDGGAYPNTCLVNICWRIADWASAICLDCGACAHTSQPIIGRRTATT